MEVAQAAKYALDAAIRRFAMARILIIDDYEPFRASVRDLLEANGYDVAVADQHVMLGAGGALSGAPAGLLLLSVY